MTKVLITGGSGFIGAHLLKYLLSQEYGVINLDVDPPSTALHQSCWRQCTLLNGEALGKIVSETRPEFVVHLAAHAVMEGRSITEFRANTEGTANVLEAVRRGPSIRRLIITSSQHVRAPGSGDPASDTDYSPYMLYGESKVITEQLTREADLDCAWTIIRPTAVWGPGHRLLADGLWNQMRKGRYLHPKGDPVVRSYGYVKNLVWQIEGLLRADRSAVDRKTFYVADGNFRQLDWVNALSRELTGRDVRTIPLWVLRWLSQLGDGLRACGLRFPLYDARLKNLITPNPVPCGPILDLLGPPPVTLEEGAKETATWLREYYGAIHA